MFFNYNEEIYPLTNVPLSDLDLFSMLCKASGKYGLFLNHGFADLDLPDEEYRKVNKEICAASGGIVSNEAVTYTPENPMEFWNSMEGRIMHARMDALMDGRTFVLFDTEEEMRYAYENVVGDDGSETNPYDGDVRIYAMTINPDGHVGTENT